MTNKNTKAMAKQLEKDFETYLENTGTVLVEEPGDSLLDDFRLDAPATWNLDHLKVELEERIAAAWKRGEQYD